MKEILKKSVAFTLSEVLITISLIGVIAAITIPSVHYNYKRAEHKTKVKKAMGTYDSLLRQVRADNLFRANSNADLYNIIHNNNCAIVTRYIKVVKQAGCTFYTNDGIWWELATDNNTLWAKVAFKEDDLNNIANKRTAYSTGVWFFASFNNGILYVNDKLAADAINTASNSEPQRANTNLQNFIE